MGERERERNEGDDTRAVTSDEISGGEGGGGVRDSEGSGGGERWRLYLKENKDWHRKTWHGDANEHPPPPLPPECFY